MAKNTQPVVHHPDGGWSIVKGGATRATKRFPTERAAIDFARKVSKNQGAELVRPSTEWAGPSQGFISWRSASYSRSVGERKDGGKIDSPKSASSSRNPSTASPTYLG